MVCKQKSKRKQNPSALEGFFIVQTVSIYNFSFCGRIALDSIIGGVVMGLRFRKSVKMGPVRLNLSNKNIGISTGIKGARVSVNSSGRATTSVGAPGTGLSYTKSLPLSKKKSQQSRSDVRISYTDPVGANLAMIVASCGVGIVIISIYLLLKSPIIGIAAMAVGLFLSIAGMRECAELRKVTGVKHRNVEPADDREQEEMLIDELDHD